MAKSNRTTVVRTVEEVEDKPNPVTGWITDFFESGGAELHPKLRELNLVITVAKFDQRTGKFATLVGTRYTDLEGVLTTLGERYGGGRFKIYVKAYDKENKPRGGAIINDYALNWDSDDPPQGDDDVQGAVVVPGQPQAPDAIALLLEGMRQQNAQLVALMMEFIKSKGGGGGGMKPGDVLDILQTGITIGSGKELPPAGDNPPADPPDQLMQLINSPIGQTIASELIKLVSNRTAAAAAPVHAAPAAAAAAVDDAMLPAQQLQP